MRTKFPIQRKCRIYLFKGPELGNGYIGIEMNLKTGAWRKRPWYNGSSKILKALIKEYGRSRFIKKICKEFSFENRFKNGKIESFYMHKYNTLAPNGINRYDPEKKPGFNNAGCHHSEETRKNIIEAINRPEVKRKISKARKEQWKNPEFIKLRSKAVIEQWKNPKFREKHNKKMIERWKNPKFLKKLECSYCNIITNPSSYSRWHGNNCKYKPKMKRTA